MENRFRIIVDTNEKLPWSFPENDHCLGEIHHKLDVGDYSIEGLEDMFFIERKASVAELAKNVNEKRWPNFLSRTQNYKHKFLLCEFGHDDIKMFPDQLPPKVRNRIKIRSKFIYKCIAQMELRFGIHIQLCNNRELAKDYAFCLMKRMSELYYKKL